MGCLRGSVHVSRVHAPQRYDCTHTYCGIISPALAFPRTAVVTISYAACTRGHSVRMISCHPYMICRFGASARPLPIQVLIAYSKPRLLPCHGMALASRLAQECIPWQYVYVYNKCTAHVELFTQYVDVNVHDDIDSIITIVSRFVGACETVHAGTMMPLLTHTYSTQRTVASAIGFVILVAMFGSLRSHIECHTRSLCM